MRQEITGYHFNDDHGNPAGGHTVGRGIAIIWQNGPLGRGEDRIEPNGAFVEGVIAAAIDRLVYYQESKFNCHENAMALNALADAMYWLEARTAKREQQGVEGTHATH